MQNHKPNKQLDYHLHKHYHYHYSSQGYNSVQRSIKNRVTSPVNMFTPKRIHGNNSGILPTRSNWKSKLNPQIGQIYQHISNNKKENKHYNLLSEKQYSQNDTKSSDIGSSFVQQQRPIKNIKNGLNSRKQELLKQINQYQQYLKSVSRPNLYIPKGQRIKELLATTKRGQFKEEYQDKKHPKSTSTLASLNEQQLLEISQKYTENNVNKQKQVNKIRGIRNKYNDNNETMTRPGLKMYSSTTTINEIIIDHNDDDDSDDNSEDVNKSVNQLVGTKEKRNIQYQSLLQQLQRQSSKLLLLSTPIDNNNNNNIEYNNNNNIEYRHDKDDDKENEYNKQSCYSYDLLRQQCGYLRDKFIQHLTTTDKFIQHISTTNGKCK